MKVSTPAITLQKHSHFGWWPVIIFTTSMQFLNVSALLQSACLTSHSKLVELLLPDFGFLPPLTCCNSSLLLSPDFTPEFTPAETWTLSDLHCFLSRVITQKSLGQPVSHCALIFGGPHTQPRRSARLRWWTDYSLRGWEPAGVTLNTLWKHSWGEV